MKLVVGLGNLGKEYERTRHNAGFICIDQLLDKYGYDSKKEEFKAIVYIKNDLNGEKVFFMKPQTYMNNSGEAIKPFCDYYKIPEDDIIVIHDEKDFPIGKDQMKFQGSSAGHNGLKSIIDAFGNEKFKRIRIGSGQPKPGWKIIDWVMSKFTDQELKELIDAFDKDIDFLNDWTKGEGFNKIMSKYNIQKED